MRTTRTYTPEEKAELMNNPYTAYVTDHKVCFTLAFKQFILDAVDKSGMTYKEAFEAAGYRDELFSRKKRLYAVTSFRKEAASPEGLKEPKIRKQPTPRKKHTETEFKELQERVLLLEQQLEFLKKSQFLKRK